MIIVVNRQTWLGIIYSSDITGILFIWVSEREEVANDGSRNAPGIPTNSERKAAVDILRVLAYVLGGFVFEYARGEYGLLASVEGNLSVFLEATGTRVRQTQM